MEEDLKPILREKYNSFPTSEIYHTFLIKLHYQIKFFLLITGKKIFLKSN